MHLLEAMLAMMVPWVFSLVVLGGGGGSDLGPVVSAPNPQSGGWWTVTDHPCPENLSHLEPKMETLLGFLSNERFKQAMRRSVAASLPDVIGQADGINRHLAFLQKEIASQTDRMQYAERVAREASGKESDPLTACPPDEKTSYCHAVEAHYTAKALILVNQGFFDALRCYQAHGLH